MKEYWTMCEITELKENEIFVFGSNTAGRHGKGAALTARKFGAVYGKGVGPMGRTYAIPTKDNKIKTLPLNNIASYVEKFINYAQQHPELVFLVTPIGCGLAGYTPTDIAPMFKKCIENKMDNVKLPESFLEVLLNN